MKKGPCQRALVRGVGSCVLGARSLLLLSVGALAFGFPALTQSQELPIIPEMEGGLPAAIGLSASASPQLPAPRLPGSVSGTILDRTGTAVVGARVRLTRDELPPSREVVTDDQGKFFFAHIAPGPFQLTITSEGFAPQTTSGNLNSGENYTAPLIELALATNVTEVRVTFTQVELAQEQLKDQEKQRVLGVIPNYYVSYVANAAPLNTRQKFQLAWKSTVDPFTFGFTAAIAGIEQAQDRFSGYGQGAQGYGKRYGATYADLVTSTYIGGAILPSLLKQDPRYFYKGTGSKKSRALYAIANAVICKGDNGHWQPAYSAILGSLASGGISNLYYPASDRDGVALTFENALIGIGASAGANLLQEFVIRKFTPNLPAYTPGTP
ncbi:MAG: carboxypeptidase-like regulatory domain-containing protein [Candidatus Acidiferrum sp.]